jgi:hypothetical protein
LFRELEERHARTLKREAEFRKQYGYIRMPVTAVAGDKRMIAVGGSLLAQDGKDYGFVRTVHDVGLHFFGEEFLDQQSALPFEEQHVPIQWMSAWVDEYNLANRLSPGDPAAQQLGSGAAWLRLAFDLYTIQDNSALQTALRTRLLNPLQFQGARHELKIAALWIAAGFTLTYEDERDMLKTHPEFIAKDQFSDLIVAVEAKSRHRTGVQGYAGGKPENLRRADVRKLLTEAYKKKVDLPLYVFVDLNLPRPENPSERDTWVSEIQATIADMTAEGLHERGPVNAAFFTNDPSHYLLRDRLVGDQDNLWVISYRYEDPKVAHPSIDVIERIKLAFSHRVAPPSSYWDDE